MNQPGADPFDFAQLPLRTFASPGIGLVMSAPLSWVEAGDEKVFQLRDSASDLEFNATAYENQGLDLPRWAELRLGAVVSEMPYLRPYGAPRPLRGIAWQGFAGEYQGVFPGGTLEKRYLVVAIVARNMLVSATVTGNVEAFQANERLLRWLLQNKLDFYTVERL